jgi:hypothetical protein
MIAPELKGSEEIPDRRKRAHDDHADGDLNGDIKRSNDS